MSKNSGSPNTSKRLLIWALDPFDTEAKINEAAAVALENWKTSQKFELQPVYVAAPSGADASLGLGVPVEDLERSLDRYVQRLKLSEPRAGQVLVNATDSRAGAIHQLLNYARKEGAEMICLTSHGRSGLSRLVLGSFAENLLRASKWPVLFLSHQGKKPGSGKTLLFATDFSENSRAAFRTFLQKTDLRDGKVILFHAISYPIPLAPMGTTFIPDHFYADQKKWAVEEGNRWIGESTTANCTFALEIRDAGLITNTGNTILRAAQELGAGTVVMASTSGAIDRTLLGSAAYETFRAAEVPVLVYGPSAVKRSKMATRPVDEDELFSKTGE
jgi:nucleotide-binding universal stress UspA family protein